MTLVGSDGSEEIKAHKCVSQSWLLFVERFDRVVLFVRSEALRSVVAKATTNTVSVAGVSSAVLKQVRGPAFASEFV